MRFLCLIIDAVSGATLAEYEIEATDAFFAKKMAGGRYTRETCMTPISFKVDCLEL